MRSPGLRKLIIPASTAPVPDSQHQHHQFQLVQPFQVLFRHEVAKLTGTVTNRVLGWYEAPPVLVSARNHQH